MEDCTYYNNTSSYDHDDLVLSSSESTLSCFNASRNATQDSTEDEFVLTVVVGIVLGLVWIATMTGIESLVAWRMALYNVDILGCPVLYRYWAVTNIDYIHRRNSRRVLTMIFTVWMLALVISLTQLGWKDETWKSRIEGKECTVNQDKYFQIFATLSSFYVPLAVILFLYWKIFQAARKRIRKRRPPPATSLLPRPAAETSLITTASSSNPSPEKTVLINNYGGVRDTGGGGGGDDAASTCTSGVGSSETTRKGTLHHQLLPPGSPGNSSTGITPETTPARKITKTVKETGEAKRERKAAKTLGIITGL
ncbi:5-hydroxytryptamine receptor [Folsomia candida]|uniref:5-hydroxytryptamine receptor n=1 Tax=Folsomia candida TaxID=158441 RepID=A0A226EHI3_FOLCA|nr:5-hydroxytryptamine receptor [Folsomia candida]